jgi:hypothetical protein
MAFAIGNLPHDFGDVKGEVIACRNRCALFDFSFLERAEIGGGAAQRVLESFTSRSLAGLEIGQIRYALRTGSAGAIVADLTIWRTGAETYELMSGRRQDVCDLLRLSEPDCHVVDLGSRTAVLALQGPQSLHVLRNLGDSRPHRHHPDAHAPARRLRRTSKTAKRAKELVNDARAMVDAGCFSILCEVTTSEVVEYLAETLPVPVISLGAGNRTHGVHIISSDLFHLWEEHVPRHSRIYTDLIPIMEDVISRYMKDVATREYLGRKETVFMNPEEALAFATDMKWERKVEELRSPAVKTA